MIKATRTTARAFMFQTATLGCVLSVIVLQGCASQEKAPPLQRPNIKPTAAMETSEALLLDRSQVKSMYTEMLAIDLASVANVAVAQNFNVLQARQAVLASEGRVESAVGAAFPAIVPTAIFEHVEGSVRATEGNIVGVGFNTFQPSIAVQWVVNPGRVIHDIAAAKKRLAASEFREEAVIAETLRRSLNQYYDLVLAQARVSAAHQGSIEAEELLRITRLRTQTGTGVVADELRAEANLAQTKQDLISAMMSFYGASVHLAVSLRLDSSVTLVPNIDELPPTHLVRDDVAIEELLGFALAFRPDLQQIRTLLEAITEDKGAAWWGAFGPQFSASYQYGGITGHANNVSQNEGIPSNLIVNPASTNGSFSSNAFTNGVIRESISRSSQRSAGRDDQTFSFSDQQRASAGVGWRLSIAAFGDMKTATAIEEQARLEADRKLDHVRAEVVAAAQISKATNELIGLSRQQVTAAKEALRLTQANLEAGEMTTLDVLQAQDSVTHARLRHAEAIVRYNQSQVDLLAAIGLLNVDAVLPGVDDEAEAPDSDG